MKSKLFSLIAFSIFASVFLVGLANAAITFGTAPTLSQNGTSFSINVTSDQTEDITFTANTITDYNDKEITFVPQTVSFDDETITITISYTVESDFDFFGKEYSTTLTADGSVSDNVIKTLTFEQTPFYDGENQGDLSISDINIDDNDFGKDEEYWYPLDNVEVKFNVANDGNWKIKDIEIQVCLWDETKGKCVMDEDDMDLSDDKFDLKSDKDTDITINFQVDPDKLTEGNTDYTLYIKAVGEIDDNDAGSYDGDETGDSDSQGIEIRTNDKFAILDDVKIPEIVSCGETVELTASVWNVGDEDMDDDEIFLEIYNYELGINKVIEFANGINSMDYERISFSFDIPENAKEKTYTILITAYDDEDMADEDIYENSEDDKAEYKIFMAVSDCAVEPEVSVSATLESEAKAGQEMTIKITLENTGSDTRTFTVDIGNYGAWGEISEAPETLTINSGSSKETYAKLNLNKDASGEKTFDILIYEGTELIKTQPVSVNIEPRNFLGITGLSIEGNEYLWGLGILNVILVIAIIIVAVRVARRK